APTAQPNRVDEPKRSVQPDEPDKEKNDDELFKRYAKYYVKVDDQYTRIPHNLMHDRPTRVTPNEIGGVGDVAYLGRVRIVQILGPDAQLVSVEGRMLYVKGYDMKSVSDDQVIGLGWVGIIGKKSYTTVLGARKTVPLVMGLGAIDAGLSYLQFMD